ncbi:ATP-binding cassette domain-containing protein [Vibrio algicola]|uniref:ATP-binding cassette domain-containing protein n=1 Tax=Vibrio algicola TaxID=2662262 RepID=A0A5Q0TCG0_9VIBR|nr:ATP-binding cassette domain-containing protein [Vibrio algicola]
MSLVLQDLDIQAHNGEYLCRGVNLSIPAGEIITIMGPSGCGKSTLLSAIAGHLAADFTLKGNMSIDGDDIHLLAPHLRQVGLLFQDDLLFPHLNVWENIAIALPDNIKKQQRKSLALACLQEVELQPLAYSMPTQISGGQRARISLLRMLQAKPKVALLDEPFSQLDQHSRSSFRQWVFAQLSEHQIPTLMVSHDRNDAPPSGSILEWGQLSNNAGNLANTLIKNDDHLTKSKMHVR